MAASKPFEGSGYDLNTYTKYRITYPSSFYSIIYNYHASHDGQLDLAHDVGTGPGMVAQALSQYFDRVIASDINANQIETAQRSLRDSHPNIHFEHCRGEDIHRLRSYGKADMVAVAESIALMNTEEAIGGFATLLKSRGTLAIWYYGLPIFANEGMEDCQEIHDKIVAKACQKMGSLKGTLMERAVNVFTAWLDNVGFPKDDWCDVQRFKWNHGRPLAFRGDEDLGFKREWVNRVSEDEVVEEKIDRGFWAKEDCDVGWVRGFVDNLLPLPENPMIDAQLEVLYGELEDAMGGQGAKAKICWPVVLLLATRY